MNNKVMHKQHLVVDVGPYTILMIAELVLVLLKITQYINYSWWLVLSPIILVVVSATFILLVTLIKALKDYFFR